MCIFKQTYRCDCLEIFPCLNQQKGVESIGFSLANVPAALGLIPSAENEGPTDKSIVQSQYHQQISNKLL